MKNDYPVVSDRKPELQTKKTGNYENTKSELREGSGIIHQRFGQILQNSQNQPSRSFPDASDHCDFLNVCKLQKGFRRDHCIICNNCGSVYNYAGTNGQIKS